MKDVKVKAYLILQDLKKVWPQNKFVYTIDCYTSGRVWWDDIITQSSFIHMGHEEFKKIMLENLDCIEYKYTLFFPTKKQCEEAIEFMESLLVMNALI